MTEPSPQLNRQRAKHLNAVIGLCVNVFVACAILMWSVFNLSFNLLAFRSSDQPEQAWWVTACMVLATCVIPFLIGLWILFKSLGKKAIVSR